MEVEVGFERYSVLSRTGFVVDLGAGAEVLSGGRGRGPLIGVRLGYLAGPAALIDEIDKLRPPYNIGVLNAEATLFALAHADEFARQAALLREERARLQRELAALPGVEAFPSEANMILVRVADGAAVFAGMKERGVLVKDVAGLHPLLTDCLRLTVGTPEENTLMIRALRASLR